MAGKKAAKKRTKRATGPQTVTLFAVNVTENGNVLIFEKKPVAVEDPYGYTDGELSFGGTELTELCSEAVDALGITKDNELVELTINVKSLGHWQTPKSVPEFIPAK